MYNFIRMQLRLLLHSRSFFVMLAVILLMAVLNILLLRWDLTEMQADRQIQPEETAESAEAEDSIYEAEVGLTVETNEAWLDHAASWEELNQTLFSSGMYFILCAVFTAIFTRADYKNGFVKNIAGQLPGRGRLALAKGAAVAVQAAVLVGLSAILNGAVGLCLFQDGITLGSLSALLQMLGLQYLLHLAFSWVIMLLCLLTRSSALSMTLGILISCNVFSLIYMVLDWLLQKLPGLESFRLEQYVLETNVAVISPSMSTQDVLRTLTVGCGFALGSLLLSALLLHRRDT